ncbi:hypothetical protein ACQP1P_21490 [Dactylosporangium sp. CA-052675]|uniref:hypothetical protein n=1 Tax=Dactylosporangium sp. CA-052675 TaxID=3239927 RepID=UPI003D8CF2EE
MRAVDVAVVSAAPALLRLLPGARETVHHPGGTAVVVRVGPLLVAVEPAAASSAPSGVPYTRHRLFAGVARGFPPVRPGDVLVPSGVVGRPAYRPDAGLLALARAMRPDDWIPDHFAHSPAVHLGSALGRSDERSLPAGGFSLVVLGALDAGTDPVPRADALDAAAAFTLALLHRLAGLG